MLHPLQIRSFRFLRFSCETNMEYKKPDNTLIIPSGLEISFAFGGSKKVKTYKSLKLMLDINREDEYFKKSPYRISLEFEVNFVMPDGFPEEKIYGAIKTSGLYITITSLRAKLSSLTREFTWGEYLLPLLDISEMQEGFVKLLDEELAGTEEKKQDENKPAHDL